MNGLRLLCTTSAVITREFFWLKTPSLDDSLKFHTDRRPFEPLQVRGLGKSQTRRRGLYRSAASEEGGLASVVDLGPVASSGPVVFALLVFLLGNHRLHQPGDPDRQTGISQAGGHVPSLL